MLWRADVPNSRVQGEPVCAENRRGALMLSSRCGSLREHEVLLLQVRAATPRSHPLSSLRTLRIYSPRPHFAARRGGYFIDLGHARGCFTRRAVVSAGGSAFFFDVLAIV